ncbi:hypothetical protein [Vibrio mediterranei]|uniref:hypothetical protein n=1 Tax=Vibrio mediterranei TaxID=689 RepID=UPI00148D9879|nr:hypothetical protein [Vibrio mediterranei]NOI26539.1 hypothetical protein [Vibrio mediterranei]
MTQTNRLSRDWPVHWPVVYMKSSIPRGRYIGKPSPIYAFSETPPQLDFTQSKAGIIARNDIDLGLNHVAFTLANILTPEECLALIQAGERLGFRPEAPSIPSPS